MVKPFAPIAALRFTTKPFELMVATPSFTVAVVAVQSLVHCAVTADVFEIDNMSLPPAPKSVTVTANPSRIKNVSTPNPPVRMSVPPPPAMTLFPSLPRMVF